MAWPIWVRSKTSLEIREQTVPARTDQSLSASARHHKIRMGPAYYHAFRWTQTGGMRDLGTINDAAGFSSANSVSGDGSVVVGESAIPKIQNSFFSHAFRWTSSGGMADLGTLGNVAGYSSATATNFDGSVVVGRSTASN